MWDGSGQRQSSGGEFGAAISVGIHECSSRNCESVTRQETDAQGHNRGSWEHDALEHRPRLVSLARRVVRQSAEAEEIADEAMARLVSEHRGGTPPREAAAWLHRTVLRLAIDSARRNARRGRHLERISHEQSTVSPDPSESTERNELREAVWRGLLELPRRQQEVMILHELEGLGYAEVAKVVGIEESTARAHAYAAREALRRKLKGWGQVP